jgi:hypothetical protein
MVEEMSMLSILKTNDWVHVTTSIIEIMRGMQIAYFAESVSIL